MDVVSYILDGLEAELALERELGVRFVECDRTLLAHSAAPVIAKPTPASAIAKPTLAPAPTPAPTPEHSSCYDFVFLHDRPLSEAGKAMMAKIIVALGKTDETAPIIVDTPVPKAGVYVILGGRALAKFQPKQKGVPGQWLTTEKGAKVLVTYSPEYILRFKEVTSAVRKIKEDMWRSLKMLKKGDL